MTKLSLIWVSWITSSTGRNYSYTTNQNAYLKYSQFHWKLLAHDIGRTHGCVRIDSETHETVLLDLTSCKDGSAIQWHQSSAFHYHFAHTRAFSLLSHTHWVQTQGPLRYVSALGTTRVVHWLILGALRASDLTMPGTLWRFLQCMRNHAQICAMHRTLEKVTKFSHSHISQRQWWNCESGSVTDLLSYLNHTSQLSRKLILTQVNWIGIWNMINFFTDA